MKRSATGNVKTGERWEWDHSGCWVQKSIPDPAMDLNPRVLQSMLKNEEQYGTVNYFKEQNQQDLKSWMRRMVTTWMLEVCEEQRCEPYVFALACNLLDQFLSVCKINRSELQLLGSACLLLASKARETITLTVAKLVIYTDNSITAQQLTDMELLLLLKLKWDIMVPTSKDFLLVLMKQLEAAKLIEEEHFEGIKAHANTFIDLIILDDEFLITPPSAVAACCLLSAISGNQTWTTKSKEQITDSLKELIQSDHDYFTSLYQSVHSSLERTLNKSESSSENEQEVEDENIDKVISQNSTPTDITQVYF